MTQKETAKKFFCISETPKREECDSRASPVEVIEKDSRATSYLKFPEVHEKSAKETFTKEATEAQSERSGDEGTRQKLINEKKIHFSVGDLLPF
jgi:hypothetical protein